MVWGHRHRGEGSDLIKAGAEATGSGSVTQVIGGGGANFGIGRGMFEVVLPQAREECSNVGGVVGRGWVEGDDVVEACGNAFQALGDLVDDLYEQAGGGAAACRHTKPFEQSVGGAEHCHADGVLVDGNVVERRDQVEQENIRPLPTGSRTSSPRAVGNWPREVMAASLLWLILIWTPPFVLDMAPIGLTFGIVEC